MSKKTIIETKLETESYHHCDRHSVILNGILETNILVRFISSNRTDTEYVIDYTTPSKDLHYGKKVKYAAAGNVYKDVVKDIEEIFSYINLELTKEEINKIGDIICKCISKCESRFGMQVKDFDEYSSDSILTIKGEDDGKPKYLVKSINVGDIDEGETFDIISGIKGDVYYDVEHEMFIWKIPTSEISFQALIAKIIEEFDNPYLIISPDLEIILDFKMDTSKVRELNSKYDRSVEQVKELYNVILKG